MIGLDQPRVCRVAVGYTYVASSMRRRRGLIGDPPHPHSCGKPPLSYGGPPSSPPPTVHRRPHPSASPLCRSHRFPVGGCELPEEKRMKLAEEFRDVCVERPRVRGLDSPLRCPTKGPPHCIPDPPPGGAGRCEGPAQQPFFLRFLQWGDFPRVRWGERLEHVRPAASLTARPWAPRSSNRRAYPLLYVAVCVPCVTINPIPAGRFIS